MAVSSGNDVGTIAELAALDLSHLQNETVTAAPIGQERGWLAAEIDPATCVVALGSEGLAEVEAMAAAMVRYPLPLLLRAPDQFDLPALTAAMAQVEDRLSNGTGVAVIDALPLERLNLDAAKAVFWVLGQLLGRPVAQKWDGTMLYDVTDTGQTFGYGVRGSYTNVELVFHTDNAFGVAPPQQVGLLCLRPARAGGMSRFCSLYAVHDRMAEADSALLRRLYRPMLFDRQAEHPPDQPKVTLAPLFRQVGGRLDARANVSLVRKGYEVAGVAMDPELAAALALLEEVSAAADLWFELPLERGQIQYLNNREAAHYRSHFEDDPDPALKRHLIRSWHRDSGLPTYDG